MLFGPLLAGGRREPAAVGPPRVTEALRQTPPIAPRKPTSSPAPGDRKALRTSTGPPGRSRGGVISCQLERCWRQPADGIRRRARGGRLVYNYNVAPSESLDH